MGVDHNDGEQEMLRLSRRVRALETASPLNNTPDSLHPGSGEKSVQIGPDADASGDFSVAIGDDAYAPGSDSVALGTDAQATGNQSTSVGATAWAEGSRSTAIGESAHAPYADSTAIGRDSTTTATNQIMLGKSTGSVVVPGTFSNPSARHLKQNIIPAPCLVTIFPELVEYEYIAAPDRRRLGYIADDLIGTDAERFVTFDDEGNVAGIDPLGLMMAQLAVMHARIVALENTPLRTFARWFWTLMRRRNG